MIVCSLYQKYEILDHQIPEYMLRTCTKKQPISNLINLELEFGIISAKANARGQTAAVGGRRTGM